MFNPSLPPPIRSNRFGSQWATSCGSGLDAILFHPAAAGKPTVLTDNALATLRAAGEVFTTCVDVVMPRLYELQPVRYVGSSGATLTGVQLKPRQ